MWSFTSFCQLDDFSAFYVIAPWHETDTGTVAIGDELQTIQRAPSAKKKPIIKES